MLTRQRFHLIDTRMNVRQMILVVCPRLRLLSSADKCGGDSDSSSCRTSLTVEDTGAACMGRVFPPVALKVICLTETTDAVLRTQNAKISVRAIPLSIQVGFTSCLIEFKQSGKLTVFLLLRRRRRRRRRRRQRRRRRRRRRRQQRQQQQRQQQQQQQTLAATTTATTTTIKDKKENK